MPAQWTSSSSRWLLHAHGHGQRSSRRLAAPPSTLDRHPQLRIVLGHLGEALPFWLWRLDNLFRLTYGWAADALGMIRLELTPSEYIKRNFWVTTSGMYDPQIMSYIVQRLGADRVMFAVDYPYEDSRVATDFLAATALDSARARKSTTRPPSGSFECRARQPRDP